MAVLDKELMLQAALQLHRFGYAVELVRFGTKKAAFEAWNLREGLSRAELQSHMRRKEYNVAIRLTKGLAVVDVDTGDLEGFDSPMIARTARGFHAYYRHTIEDPKTFKWERGDCKLTGYVLAPPSWNFKTETRYEWLKGIVRPEELPLLPDLQKEVKRTEPLPKPKELVHRNVEAMRKWIRRVHSVEGQGGDRDCFRVACKICSVVRDELEALAEIMAWNAEGYAKPPWSEKELIHKIRCALRRVVT